ncbi:unnamed protein product, partial [Ectocarpus sp. 12 AP-2014]
AWYNSSSRALVPTHGSQDHAAPTASHAAISSASALLWRVPAKRNRRTRRGEVPRSRGSENHSRRAGGRAAHTGCPPPDLPRDHAGRALPTGGVLQEPQQPALEIFRPPHAHGNGAGRRGVHHAAGHRHQPPRHSGFLSGDVGRHLRHGGSADGAVAGRYPGADGVGQAVPGRPFPTAIGVSAASSPTTITAAKQPPATNAAASHGCGRPAAAPAASTACDPGTTGSGGGGGGTQEEDGSQGCSSSSSSSSDKPSSPPPPGASHSGPGPSKDSSSLPKAWAPLALPAAAATAAVVGQGGTTGDGVSPADLAPYGEADLSTALTVPPERLQRSAAEANPFDDRFLV